MAVLRQFVDVGIVLSDSVYTDPCDSQKENGSLCAVKLFHAARGFLILCFLGQQKVQERDTGENKRREEIKISRIGQNKAEQHVYGEPHGHKTFGALAQREQVRPQLRYKHGDHRGISPAPAVDGIRKAVGQITEGRDKEQSSIQEELQAEFDVPLDAEQKEDTQERRARITERAVLHLSAGQKALRKLTAGADLVKEIDSRIEGDALIAEHCLRHRKKDHAAHSDADRAGGEHCHDLKKAARPLAFGKRNVAEQRIEDRHKDDADDKVEIADGRKTDRDNKEPGPSAGPHLLDAQKDKRENDQRIQKDRLAEACDQGKAAESIDQGTCQAALVMCSLRPAEAAECAEGKTRAVVFDKDQKTIEQIDISGRHQRAQKIERISHTVIGERRHRVGAVSDREGIGGDRLEISVEQCLEGLPVPPGDIDHGLEVLRIGIVFPHKALVHDQKRRVDDQRGDDKEKRITDIVGYTVLSGYCFHWGTSRINSSKYLIIFAYIKKENTGIPGV